MTDLLSPTTPGEILAEEFLAPLGITQYKLDAQAHHDLEAARDALAAGTLEAIVPVHREAG